MAVLPNQIQAVFPQIFYVNGLNTTQESAQKAAGHLASFIGRQVLLHYNDATPPALFNAMIVEGAIGIGGGITLGASTFVKNKQTKKVMQQTAFATCIVTTLLLTLQYALIQDAKNRVAETLAGRVRAHLDKNPLERVVLVLHSQGADVGNRALKHHLREYANRIDVIAIGPAITVPKRRAAQVINISNKGDVISKVATAINLLKSSGRYRERYFVDKTCATGACHGLDDYLGMGHLATGALLDLARPRCFDLNTNPVSCAGIR